MFLLKKVMTPLLLPPGIIIVLLMLSSVVLLFRRKWKATVCTLLLGLTLWGLSITPVGDTLLRGLESGLEIPVNPHGDVIILLCGGVRDSVPDFSGQGTPSEEMMSRIVTAVRLQRALGLPVIVSGGSAYRGDTAEAPIVRRVLGDLGVPGDKIITEEKSRDTYENAQYSSDVCRKQGYRNPILVTSAFHMRRAIKSFERHHMQVTSFPAGFKAEPTMRYRWYDYLPDASELRKVSLSMKEYLGILFLEVAY